MQAVDHVAGEARQLRLALALDAGDQPRRRLLALGEVLLRRLRTIGEAREATTSRSARTRAADSSRSATACDGRIRNLLGAPARLLVELGEAILEAPLGSGDDVRHPSLRVLGSRAQPGAGLDDTRTQLSRRFIGDLAADHLLERRLRAGAKLGDLAPRLLAQRAQLGHSLGSELGGLPRVTRLDVAAQHLERRAQPVAALAGRGLEALLELLHRGPRLAHVVLDQVGAAQGLLARPLLRVLAQRVELAAQPDEVGVKALAQVVDLSLDLSPEPFLGHVHSREQIGLLGLLLRDNPCQLGAHALNLGVQAGARHVGRGGQRTLKLLLGTRGRGGGRICLARTLLLAAAAPAERAQPAALRFAVARRVWIHVISGAVQGRCPSSAVRPMLGRVLWRVHRRSRGASCCSLGLSPLPAGLLSCPVRRKALCTLYVTRHLRDRLLQVSAQRIDLIPQVRDISLGGGCRSAPRTVRAAGSSPCSSAATASRPSTAISRCRRRRSLARTAASAIGSSRRDGGGSRGHGLGQRPGRRRAGTRHRPEPLEEPPDAGWTLLVQPAINPKSR